MHWGAMAWVWTQKGDASTGTGAPKRLASTRAIMITPCRQPLAAIPIASPQQSGVGAASVVPSITSAAPRRRLECHLLAALPSRCSTFDAGSLHAVLYRLPADLRP